MPQVTASELARFLLRNGFVERRQSGSHLILHHESDPKRRVAIPMHSGIDLGRGLAIDILRQAGFTVDDYLRLR